jgi:hypothetical protein
VPIAACHLSAARGSFFTTFAIVASMESWGKPWTCIIVFCGYRWTRKGSWGIKKYSRSWKR